MKQLLKTHFGYDRFRPLQEEIIRNVFERHDTFVLMPTGGGKSLCYQLPALKFNGLTLVVSPLISLMKDQVDALTANGMAARYINSSLSYQEISRIQQQLRAGEIKILYVAPERLGGQAFQEFLKMLRVSLIAIDEAHCISEWGHDFRPDYRNLKFLKNQFPNIPIIALTATATPKVQEDIVRQLALDNPKTFISSFDRENLTFLVVRKKQAFDKLLKVLRRHKNESAIIYCFPRKETEEIVFDLKAEGFQALPYHAGLDGEVRKRNQDLFIKDEVRIMAATIAFGMGIDKPDVRLVVHYTFPKTLEGYYQEIGRAGRDGLKSECVLFYSYGDKIKHEYFLEKIKDTEQQDKTRAKLKNVIEYCERTTCRRRYLLGYFGEEYRQENCGACDICLSSGATFDATNIARKIFAGIVHTGSRFGKNYIIDVLKGKAKEQIHHNRHDALPVFGIVRDFADDGMKHIMRSLLERGLLGTRGEKYPTLFIPEKGTRWIKEKQTLSLPEIPSFDFDKGRVKVEHDDRQEYDTGLFETLRGLRKQIADERGVPPFVIFGDVSLREMAHYFPIDPQSFLRIRGVGANKLENLGEVFMRVIKKHLQDNNLSSIEMSARDQPRDHRKNRKVRREAQR